MKRIAIVNRTNLKNYGSVLQVFALCEAVKELGYTCEIVWERGTISKHYDFRIKKLVVIALRAVLHPSIWRKTMKVTRYVVNEKNSKKKDTCFDEFVGRYLQKAYYTSCELKKIARSDYYFKFVCGSDQVWCSTSIYVDPLMYLRFAPQNKRIAYAPSLGREYIPRFNRRIMKRYISEIPTISIREDVGQMLIKELTGRDAPIVVDPTLLLTKERWDELEKPIDSSAPFLLCYFLSQPSKKTLAEIERIAISKKLKIVSLTETLSLLDDSICVSFPECGPCEFISYIKNAELILTDSYHGMIFSIIYEKIFWSIERNDVSEYDQSSRQLSLLRLIGLTERYLLNQDYISDLESINYNSINERIESLRDISTHYLYHALEEK